jgi:type I restriction-modification system DNA methylase subunit
MKNNKTILNGYGLLKEIFEILWAKLQEQKNNVIGEFFIPHTLVYENFTPA